MQNIIPFLQDFITQDWTQNQPIITPAEDYAGKPAFTVKGAGVVPDGIIRINQDDNSSYMFYNNYGQWMTGFGLLSEVKDTVLGYNEFVQKRLKKVMCVNPKQLITENDDFIDIFTSQKDMLSFNQGIVGAFNNYFSKSNADINLILQQIQNRWDVDYKGLFKINYIAHWTQNNDIILYSKTNTQTGAITYNVSISHTREITNDWELMHIALIIEKIVYSLCNMIGTELIALKTLRELDKFKARQTPILLGDSNKINACDMLFELIDYDIDPKWARVNFKAQQIGFNYSDAGKIADNSIKLNRFEHGTIQLNGFKKEKPMFRINLANQQTGNGIWLTTIN